MPRYDYVCDTCDTHEEAVRSIDERDRGWQCPWCYRGTMVRQPAAPAFQLRGPGFYVNDYKGKP